VFLRNACACVLLAPLLVYRGRSLLRAERVGPYGVRVTISLLSMQAWFYALSLIPIGEVTAISYLAPRCLARWVRSFCWARWCAFAAGRRWPSALRVR